MRLFIPACGDRIVLTEPWMFSLYLESRNLRFAKEHGHVSKEASWRDCGRGTKKLVHVLPAGTVLECDRVYIRTFNKSRAHLEDDYDSITWKVMKGGKPVRNQRFWAKLSSCCEIECEVESTYRDRVKLTKVVLGS